MHYLLKSTNTFAVVLIEASQYGASNEVTYYIYFPGQIGVPAVCYISLLLEGRSR